MSTAFDLNAFKRSVVDILKPHLCPESRSIMYNFNMNAILEYEIAQSFKPYSTAYRDNRRTFDVQMVMGKVGNPSGSLTLSLMSDLDNAPNRVLLDEVVSGTVIPSDGVSTVTWTFDLSELSGRRLDSNAKYWIKLNQSATIDLNNYYNIYRSTVDTGYMMGTGKYRVVGGISAWESLNADFNFKCSFPTWIYPDYPFDNLNDFSFPRIAVDILGRPNVDERWLCINKGEYTMNLGITVYSKYPEELDELISYIDRILWFERLNIANIRNLHPTMISPITQPRAQLFVKTSTYDATYMMFNQEIS